MSEEQFPEKHRHSVRESFRFAWRGIGELVRSERHFRFHLVIAAAVCVLALALQFSLLKWTILLLTIGLVMTAEALNSAVEAVVDLIRPDQHPLAGKAKDIAAGAVLIAAVISVIIGLLLFVPPLWNLVRFYLE